MVYNTEVEYGLIWGSLKTESILQPTGIVQTKTSIWCVYHFIQGNRVLKTTQDQSKPLIGTLQLLLGRLIDNTGYPEGYPTFANGQAGLAASYVVNESGNGDKLVAVSRNKMVFQKVLLNRFLC